MRSLNGRPDTLCLLTVQFFVRDIESATDFYTRLLKRAPNFAPTPDFKEGDHIVPNVTFQLGEGEPRPTLGVSLLLPPVGVACG